MPRNVPLQPAAYSDPEHPCFVTIRAVQRTAPFVRRELNDAVVDVLLAEPAFRMRGLRDRVLRRSESAHEVLEYIGDNPVRRGLARDPISYPWTGCPDPL